MNHETLADCDGITPMLNSRDNPAQDPARESPAAHDRPSPSPATAQAILNELASVFLNDAAFCPSSVDFANDGLHGLKPEEALPKHDNMYRVLVEQIPALVFIAYLERGVSEMYVSPQIESALGFTQAEWLEDPIRWYGQIHPDDKQRWSSDAAEMFLTGKSLKSAYRVIARDGHVVWFQCEVKMVRRPDGRPWFLHGVGFDITELKQTEETLRQRTVALQNLSARLLRLQDDEHKRIARELHDSVGQYLAAVKMNLLVLKGSAADGNDAIHSEIEQLIERCIVETRTLSHLLHPPALDELGFAAAAQWYVEGFAKRSGIHVTIELPPQMDRLPHAVELTLFRVLQEGLTNIHRHSGSPKAEIVLAINDAEVSLQITDHGRGMPQDMLELFQKTGSHAGIGLAGMRERVNELAGRLEITSTTHGTQINVTISLSPNPQQK
ncbi:MAG: PAS domain-containing protein [Candidatus Acidiferrales bacterium]